MVEDAGELAGHALDLVLGELEAREARDVEDLVAVSMRAWSLGARRAASASGGGAGSRGPSAGGAGGTSVSTGARACSSRIDSQAPTAIASTHRKPSQARATSMTRSGRAG